jgi:excinuclease ABC subunit C
VRFRRGRPEKEGYRHYLFRDITGMDDFSMINRLMGRRLRHGLEPGRKGDMSGLPDLFVIDGGKGQLSAALDALAKLSPESQKAPVDIVAIAKDRDGSGERIFLPGARRALRLEPHDPVLRFLQRVRDEAHRFGIQANRKGRIRLRLRSRLTDIPGIGPRRMSALLSRFGSIERLRQADPQEISEVRGISLALARKIKEHLSKGDGGD